MMSFLNRRLTAAVVLLLFTGCSEQSTDLSAPDTSSENLTSSLVQLTCTVQVNTRSLHCAQTQVTTPAGTNSTLIVGGQHQFVRMANGTPTLSGDTFSAAITVQNLTQQAMGTLDGTTPHADGVRVFFVQPPTNGVEVGNADGTAAFTGSSPQQYFEYSGAALGGDAILSSGEVSQPKTWDFALNDASSFEFAVLIATEVADETAYSINLTRIAAGNNHSCGDGSDGNVYCWGNNFIGQLGDSTTTDSRVPVRVIAPPGVVLSNVITGGAHSCATGSDGNAYCWGSNTGGRLGDGTTVSSSTPVAVRAPTGVTLSGLTTRVNHTCAQGSDGNAYCWGSGTNGILGNGSTAAQSAPVAVSAPSGVSLSGLSAGATHTCAIGSDNNAYCWGLAFTGALGDSTTVATTSTPIPVRSPTGVIFSRIVTGNNFTCATATNGKTYCWGMNDTGQLGIDAAGTGYRWPQLVALPAGVTLTAITAGNSHVCGSGSDGQLYCWGGNSEGQYGNGTTTWSAAPEPVNYESGAMSNISAGSTIMCGIGEDGQAYCWGNNFSGQLGDGTITDRLTPVKVASTRS